jgi:hypothetical protein
LVGRPIAFEETLGHHPQKAARILAVYAFFIDDGFDMRRAWYSAAHSEKGLLVSKVAADPEGHISAPNKACTTTRLIEPTSVVELIDADQRTLPLLAIHFRGGRQRKPRQPGQRFWLNLPSGARCAGSRRTSVDLLAEVRLPGSGAMAIDCLGQCSPVSCNT